MGEESNKWMDNLMYNITYLRKSLGLSEKQMADIPGIGGGSLKKIEKGIFPERMSVEVLHRIKTNFCRSSDDFSEGKFGEI
ncbi:MAG: helix-turn-helix transcriptional regulator [Eubacteriaceae bacterium]|nr:helix-turn-helix transcriptional regulator [Eubacteriaceae bacterium]